MALTAAQDPAEARGVWGCSAGWWEPCTSPRWLLGELVCICFCIGPCHGGRSNVPRKTIPVNKWQLLLKSLQEKLLSVTVRPLEQEPHSPCVYSKGCLAIWKVSSLFISNTRKSFLCISWERKPQKFPLLSMYSAQNTLSGNACSCLKVFWKLCSL